MTGRLPPAALHALLALALGIGGIVLLTWSGRALEDIESRSALASTELARSSAQRAAMRQLDAAAALALPRYHSLAAAGFVGTPSTQDWQARVIEAALRHRVELEDARFLPPRALPSGTEPDKALPLLASTLALKARLMHEGDFAAFIADLQAQPDARVRISDCALDRLQPASPAAADRGAHLALECRLDWLTIAPLAAAGRR